MDEILTQWNNAAKTYFLTQEASDDAAFNRAVVKERFSDLSGKKILDAGCGYGTFTSYFESIGADALGCDGSEEMLVIAKEQYPDCKFDLVDLQRQLPYQNEQFDLVFCNQVLMDLADIQGLFGEFSRILKTAGILYFVIVHPASYPGEWLLNDKKIKTAKIIRNYAIPYKLEHAFCGKTTHFHRPISFYLNLAAQNHFTLVHMEEPCARHEIQNVSNHPPFLFAEFQKMAAIAE